eukprot:CFRG2813T1
MNAAFLTNSVGLVSLQVYLHTQIKSLPLFGTWPLVAIAVSSFVCLYFIVMAYQTFSFALMVKILNKNPQVKDGDKAQANSETEANYLSVFYVNAMFTMLTLVFTFFLFKEVSEVWNFIFSTAAPAFLVYAYSTVEGSKKK